MNGQTCAQLAAAIEDDPNQTECPQMIYDLCPFSCGKCGCCSNDFSKCDVEGAASSNNPATCAQAIAGSNGLACDASQEIADNCPGSCEPQGACATPPGTIHIFYCVTVGTNEVIHEIILSLSDMYDTKRYDGLCHPRRFCVHFRGR